MSIEKLKKYEASVVAKSLYGLYLEEGEKERLYELCITYGIPITYPRLFEDDNHYYLWGIRKDGIGLISTLIMNYLDKNGVIFQSLDELEESLKAGKL